MTGENGTPPTAEEIPDLIGREGRANTVAGLLRQVQIRLFHLEAEQVANKLGVAFRVTLEKRIAGAEKVGKHKTSMLQDVEVGRVLEIDALVGAVVELGRMTDTPTPHIDADLMPDVLAMLGEEREGG